MNPDEEVVRRRRTEFEQHAKVFRTLPGGDSLVEVYGQVPDFHDSEVEALDLRIKGASKIRVSNPYPDIFAQGCVIVTFTIDETIYLELEGLVRRTSCSG